MSPTTPAPKASLKEDARQLKSSIDAEAAAAKHALHDATSAARHEASAFASDVKESAMRDAEDVKHEAAAGLRAFAGAVRNAGEELADNDQGTAARFVREAASGLERLATSLGKKQLEDIVEDVRDFGRKNPAAFIAGSVLAGMALGRFVRSSDEKQSSDTGGGASGNGSGRVK